MTAPSRAHPASASDAIADVLRGPRRPVEVLAAFAPAVYLAHDDGVLAIVARDGVHPPNGVVDTAPTRQAPFAGVRPHQRGWVGQGQVVLPRRHLRVTRWFDPVPRLATVDPMAVRSAVARARAHLAGVVGPTPDDLAEPLGALVAALARDGGGDSADAVAHQLLGRGPGLTPAGDDVLAGLLAAVVVLDRALPDRVPTTRLVSRVHRLGVGITRAAGGRTTSMSAALLAHATRGAVAAPAADVLHALAGRGSLPVALDRLLAVGATSGRDLALGLLAGAGLVLAPASRPPVTPAATEPRIL